MNEIANRIELNNGSKMPVIGLGTWQIPEGEITENAVTWALDTGYRLIDTAKIYHNEASVGAAIRNSSVPRSEIFLTTKLWGTDQFNIKKAFDASIAKLGLDYIDLYLVHWPVPGFIKSTWRSMEELLKTDDRCKAIGVSNYSIYQLQQVLKVASVKPVINQVKFSPYDNKADLLKFCKENQIVLESYSPLTRGKQLTQTLLVEIARKYNKTAAQVLLRWGIQKGTIVIPKSQTQQRIAENINIFDFEINEADMEKLDQIQQ